MVFNHFKKQSAFSLIELIIVMAIIGVIASWAIPSYQQFILSSHRSDAKSALLKLQLEQENWRTTHSTYASLDELHINPATENGYYQLAIIKLGDNDQFLATATPNNSQKKDSCGTFAINQFGAIYETYASVICWGE